MILYKKLAFKITAYFNFYHYIGIKINFKKKFKLNLVNLGYLLIDVG